MQHWHFDNKRKEVIYDSVEKFVGHLSPGQMSYRLEFVVYEQLGAHHNKTCRQYGKRELIIQDKQIDNRVAQW